MTDDNEGILIGGDELFDTKRYYKHYLFMLNKYVPHYEKPISFFLSCSKYKPFYLSPYRRLFTSMLSKKIGIREISQIYTVSEPAIIIPEELDDTIITNYDFPPENLKEYGKNIFIKRLSKVLPKLFNAHQINFYVLPKHHREIFESAVEEILQNEDINNVDKILISSKIKYAPPVTYNLPKTKEIIIETLRGISLK